MAFYHFNFMSLCAAFSIQYIIFVPGEVLILNKCMKEGNFSDLWKILYVVCKFLIFLYNEIH